MERRNRKRRRDCKRKCNCQRVIDRDISATNESAASGNQTKMLIDRTRVIGTDLFAGSHCVYFLYLLLLSRFCIIQTERPYLSYIIFLYSASGNRRFAKSYRSMDTSGIYDSTSLQRDSSRSPRISIKRQVIKARRCNAWRNISS